MQQIVGSRYWVCWKQCNVSSSNISLRLENGKNLPNREKRRRHGIFQNQLIHKYEVPYVEFRNVSLYIAPMVEVEDLANNCENTWIYTSDTDTPSLLVFSLKLNDSWVVLDSSFAADPHYNSYTIEGRKKIPVQVETKKSTFLQAKLFGSTMVSSPQLLVQRATGQIKESCTIMQCPTSKSRGCI